MSFRAESRNLIHLAFIRNGDALPKLVVKQNYVCESPPGRMPGG